MSKALFSAAVCGLFAIGILAGAANAQSSSSMTSVTNGVNLLNGMGSSSGGGSPGVNVAPAGTNPYQAGAMFQASQEKMLVNSYNADKNRRSAWLRMRLQGVDRQIAELQQRRRHALYRYQHGGGYARDLQAYQMLTSQVQSNQMYRYNVAAAHCRQNIANLQKIYYSTSNPSLRLHCQQLIAQAQVLQHRHSNFLKTNYAR